MEMQLLLGADPEVFMRNEKGTIVSAHNVIPGTKEEPHPVVAGAIQVDGLALEFNIEPAADRNTFNRHLVTVMTELKAALPKGHELAIQGSHRFPMKYMHAQPAESLVLGCDPDFNAYTGLPNPAPNGKTNLRTAAGHVHFGWTKDEVIDDWFMKLCCDFVKHLDWSLGLYCWYQDPDRERKKLYGKAGAFRPKPYGVEYRTAGNVWISTAAMRLDTFDICQKAFFDMVKGIEYSDTFFNQCIRTSFYKKDAMDIINNKFDGHEMDFLRNDVYRLLKDYFHVRNV